MFFIFTLGVALATNTSGPVIGGTGISGTGISGTGNSAAGLTDYPGFLRPSAKVEAIIDRGPIQELIVKCGAKGNAIISFSKVDRRFCTPRHSCDPSLGVVLARTCGRD